MDFFAWLLKQKESQKKLRKMNQSETVFFRGTLSNTTLGKNVRNTWLKRIPFKHFNIYEFDIKMLFESEKLWSFILEVYKIAGISTIFHFKLDGVLHINKWHFYR